MISYRKILNKLIKINYVSNIFQSLTSNYKILYYHGVKDDYNFSKMSGPNKHLFIKKSEFIKQMEYLENANYNVISIDDLYNTDFKPPKNSIIITFDDGYKDNLDIVYPILKKKNYPFTIYIISEIINNDPWVWWIEAWNKIEKINEVEFNKKTVKLKNEKDKTKFYFELKNKFKKLNLHEQKDLIKKIFNFKKLSDMKSIFLDKKDIELLINDDLVTIGSHTDDHLSLKNFDKTVVDEQIFKSKLHLEKTFNIKIKHFSFPYGQKEDIKFDEDLTLSKYNYCTGVTTLEYMYKRFNKYYLSRCSIGPYIDIEDFKRKILGVDSLLKKIFLR